MPSHPGQTEPGVIAMKPATASLTRLLSRDPAAREYFHALPELIQESLRGMEIFSFEELQAQAVRFLFVPF